MRRTARSLCAGALLATVACRPDHDAHGGADSAALAVRDLPVPAEHQAGRAAFDAHCALCHGEAALGTEQGPPLVHVIYEPSHHADGAFYLAAAQGVRAHHWHFGDMPPVPDATREEVEAVIGYVRWLQRAAGIR
jgi:mono/diheme cytochrome c family protein